MYTSYSPRFILQINFLKVYDVFWSSYCMKVLEMLKTDTINQFHTKIKVKQSYNPELQSAYWMCDIHIML